MDIFVRNNASLGKNIFFLILFFGATSTLNATSLYYTFEGTINSFNSFNNSVTLSDYDVDLGTEEVRYVFEVDFNRNTSSSSNSSGTWHYFYSDLLFGGIVNGEHPETNHSFNVYFNSITNQGHMQGGSRVEVKAFESSTSSWKVEDWYVGQQLNLTDGGFLSTGSGGAVYFYGDVELKSISSTNPVPVPGALVLFISALGGLGMAFRRKA